MIRPLILAGFLFAAACQGIGTADIPFWPQQTGEAPARPVALFREDGILPCTDVVELGPLDVAERLEAEGFTVEWRYERSAGGSTGVSHDVPRPPAGTILTDVVAQTDGVAFVFIAHPHDRQFRPISETRCQSRRSP